MNRAAEAAVGKFHQPGIELLIRTKATAAQEGPIDAHLPELIDQHGQPLAAMEEQVAQQGRFASAQKASHHGDGKAFC